MAAAWTWIATAGFWVQLAVGIVAIWGLRYLSNLLRRPDLPKEESRTNSFSPAGNFIMVGQAVPVVYGKRKVVPGRVQEYIETVGDDQFYYALYLVSAGEIQSITNIQLNDQPIGNFDQASFETRMGTASQTKIPWFDDTRVTRSHGVTIDADAPGPGHQSTFTMPVGTTAQSLIVNLRFPSGLATAESNGNLKSNKVNVTIEYRVFGAGGWTLLFTGDNTEAKRNQFSRPFRVDNLTLDRYEVRVTRNSTQDRSANSVYSMIFDTIDTITYGNTTFNNFSMLGIRVKGTDQISGTVRCTLDCEGVKVRTRSGGAWTGPVYTRNPAWHVTDMMTNTRYGAGAYIADAKLDIPALESAAAYYDELRDNLQAGTEARFVHDMVFDAQLNFYDAVDTVLQNCRSTIVETNDKYRLHVDRVRTVTQAFSNANMRRKSFRKGTVTLQDEFTQVEVGYIDEANNYTRDVVRFPTTNPPVLKRKQFALEGTTRRSQALIEAKFLMNSISALSEWCSFDTFLEGLAAEVGDVVEVSHDVPQWGYPGRIEASVFVSGTTYDLTVDRSDLPTPTDHRMLVRHETDLLEYGTVVSKTGNVIRVSGLSRLPKARDSAFHYGAANATGKLFQIQQGSFTPEFFRSLFLVDYDAAVYSDTGGLVYPARSPSNLPMIAAPPNSVTTLTALEQLVQSPEGAFRSRVQLHWNNPVHSITAGVFHHVDLYISTDGGQKYQLIGHAERPPFYSLILPVQATAYWFKAVAVSFTNVAQTITAAPSVSVTLVGDMAAPGIPTGVSALGLHKRVELEWTNPTAADLDVVEIWRSLNNDSNNSVKVAEVRGVSWSDDGLAVGTAYWYWLRARDLTGNVGAYHAGQFAGTTATTAILTDADVDQVAPAQPGVITVTPATGLNADGNFISVVDLDWPDNAEGDLAGYEAKIKITSNTIWERQFCLQSQTRFLSLFGGLGYDVEVRAIDVFGNVSAVRTATFTSLNDTTVPSAPSGVSGLGLHKRVELEWTNPVVVDYDRTEIWRSPPGVNDRSVSIRAAEVRGISWSDDGLAVGTTYYYWLRAKDFSGNVGDFHATQFAGLGVTTAFVTDADVDQVAPAQPGAFTIITPSVVINADGTVNSKVSIQWPHNSETDLAGYECRLRITGQTWGTQFTAAGKNEAEFGSLVPGDGYSIELYAIDVFGNQSTVRTGSFTAAGDTTAPATPVSLTSSHGLGLAVNLDWDDNTESDLKEYEVYRHTADASGSSTLIVKIRASRFIDATVKEGTRYWYWIKARDFSGNLSAFSASTNIIPRLIDPWAFGAILDHFTYAIAPDLEVDPNLWSAGAGFGGDIISTAAHEIELHTNTTSAGNAIIRCKKSIRPDAVFSKTRLEWRMKVNVPGASWANVIDFNVGLFAETGYFYSTEPAAWVRKGTNSNTIKFFTRTSGGSSETTDNVAIDPSAYHVYVIEHEVGSGDAVLYVDDVEKVRHSANNYNAPSPGFNTGPGNGSTDFVITLDYVAMIGVRV